MGKEELLRRGREYAGRYRLSLANELGFGVHGIVFVANDQAGTARSAVKIHEREEPYRRERDVYLRLKDRGVKRIRGCEVPLGPSLPQGERGVVVIFARRPVCVATWR